MFLTTSVCRNLTLFVFDVANLVTETRLVEERAEFQRRKKEREEAHLYLNVDVLSEETFKSHHGFNLTSLDLPTDDPALPEQHRVLKDRKSVV